MPQDRTTRRWRASHWRDDARGFLSLVSCGKSKGIWISGLTIICYRVLMSQGRAHAVLLNLVSIQKCRGMILLLRPSASSAHTRTQAGGYSFQMRICYLAVSQALRSSPYRLTICTTSILASISNFSGLCLLFLIFHMMPSTANENLKALWELVEAFYHTDDGKSF